jgi:hypothetical protein
LLLLVIVVFGNRGTSTPAAAISAIDDQMVVSAEELKNRREVRPDDFRPRGAARLVVEGAPAPAAATTPATPQAAETLAARRARRQNDPEDVLTLKARRGATPRPEEAPWYDGPVYVTAGSAAGTSPGPAGPTARSPEVGARGTLTAGTEIPAVLTAPLELRGGSATVIARADGHAGAAALQGARFIGTASAGTGRVTIHFRAVVLSDGRQARVDAEAQDDDGAFGLRVEGDQATGDERGSVLGDVAQGTATDVLSSTIGFGVAGQAVDRYMSGTRSHRDGSTARAVSLPAGTRLQVFLNEPIELGR